MSRNPANSKRIKALLVLRGLRLTKPVLVVAIVELSACVGKGGAPTFSRMSSEEASPIQVPESHFVYGTCVALIPNLAEETPDLVRASERFELANQHWTAGRYREAAVAYLASAEILQTSPAQNKPLFLKNRLIAYANAVNSWLTHGSEDEARQLLISASAHDPELVNELAFSLNALPNPMRCVLKRDLR